MGDATRKSALYDAFAHTGKALASGKRLELLDLLAQGERTVDALAKAAGLNLNRFGASADPQAGRARGHPPRRRKRIHYRLAGEDVAALYALLRQVAQAHQAGVEAARTAYLGDPGGAEEVGREELLARARAGELVVLDVRPAEEYEAGHIPGALSIPVEELAERISELPDDAEVVAYCRGAYWFSRTTPCACCMSADARRSG